MKAAIEILNLINSRIEGNILLEEDFATLSARLAQYGVFADTKMLFKITLTSRVQAVIR